VRGGAHRSREGISVRWLSGREEESEEEKREGGKARGQGRKGSVWQGLTFRSCKPMAYRGTFPSRSPIADRSVEMVGNCKGQPGKYRAAEGGGAGAPRKPTASMQVRIRGGPRIPQGRKRWIIIDFDICKRGGDREAQS